VHPKPFSSKSTPSPNRFQSDPRIASKAAYLAAVIGDGNAKKVVALAAQSHYAVIRAAAAAARPCSARTTRWKSPQLSWEMTKLGCGWGR
jgi:hypothetical protein